LPETYTIELSRRAERIRAGDYRIVYTVRHEVLIVLVVAVGHRREIYDRLL
jgi:mRNA interferase RelE/StbE